MADLKLRLTASEFEQVTGDAPAPGFPPPTKRYLEGEEFTARDQTEYDRLVEAGAAVAADAPDPDDPSSLKGDDLKAALAFYGLPDEGKVDQKRAAIQAHLDANPDAARYTPAG